MTSITVRTDDYIKSLLEEKAELYGLTLSGYLNVQLRKILLDEDDDDDLEIDEKRMAYYIAEADKVMNDPNMKWLDAREVTEELNKKYGVCR